jgi:hypothetical protein
MCTECARCVCCACCWRAQTKYRVHLARKFLKLTKDLRARQQALERTATVLQRAFRGMKGRQWAEIARNVLGVQRIRGPIQDAIARLVEEEDAVRKRYTMLEKRLKAQEVCFPVPPPPHTPSGFRGPHTLLCVTAS